MPGVFHEPMGRKTFLKTTAAIAGATAFAPVTFLHGVEPSPVAHLALLSDTHLPADAANEYRGFRPVDNLKRVVPQVLAAKPRAVIINGDAARLTGELGDYIALRQLLSPLAAHAPITIGLGNHDHRNNFFKIFANARQQDAPVNGKHVAVMELAGLRFVVLDSLLYVNKVAGLLGKAQRAWLAKHLATSDDKPTLLFVHHTLGDGDGDLLDIDRLYRMIEPHRKVKAIFYGHSHRYAIEQHGHVQLVNLPAVGYNFVDTEPVGWLDARFTTTGVELTLKAIGGNETGNGETKTVIWS